MYAATALFVTVAAVVWFVSVACLDATFPDDPPARSRPRFARLSFVAAAAVGLTGLVPFPGGFWAGLGVWAVAAVALVGPSPVRAGVLVGYLALGSLLGRYVLLGVLSVT